MKTSVVAVFVSALIAMIGLWIYQVGTMVMYRGGFDKVSNFDLFGLILITFILGVSLPMAEDAFRKFQIVKGTILTVVFVCFVAGTLPMAVSRYGEAKDHQKQEITNTSEAKKLLEDELEAAKSRVSAANKEVVWESRNGGCKDNCKKWEQKEKDAQARVDKLTADLTAFIKNNNKVAPGDTSRIASVLNISAENYDKYQPLAIPLGIEVGIWTFGWIAISAFNDIFGHKQPKQSTWSKFLSRVRKKREELEEAMVPPTVMVPAFVAEPVVEETFKTFDEQVVVAALKKANGPVNNNLLASMMGVSAAESTRRVQEVEHLVKKVRNGKEVLISLR